MENIFSYKELTVVSIMGTYVLQITDYFSLFDGGFVSPDISVKIEFKRNT